MKKGQDIKVTFRVHEMSEEVMGSQRESLSCQAGVFWALDHFKPKFQLYFILVNNVKKSDSPKERRRKKRKRSREPCCIRLVMII